jgi:hypothetical protein
MTRSIARHRDIESLKTAASWPGADRATVVSLATRLVAARADAEGFRYFQEQADANPGQPLPLTLAGFFQARIGANPDEALAKLDTAAAADLGLPQYFRGLALSALPPDPKRAEQAIRDLEFVLAVRDQFPALLMRAVHHGLAAAYTVLGKDDLAAEASRNSGLDSLPQDSTLLFGSFWVSAEDGFHFTTPRIWRPEPEIHVAQGYDFGDFALISTGAGLVAIDAGTTEARVRAALEDLDLAGREISHLIFTPTAVVPYLITRDNFTARLYQQRTGYWQPDGAGLQVFTSGERAAALDLLAGGKEEPYVNAATTLIGQGDAALALEIIQPGLLSHPASTALAALRQTALHRLLEQHSQQDPFRFLIYAELAGTELGPVS